jgi:hypothetical protein
LPASGTTHAGASHDDSAFAVRVTSGSTVDLQKAIAFKEV